MRKKALLLMGLIISLTTNASTHEYSNQVCSATIQTPDITGSRYVVTAQGVNVRTSPTTNGSTVVGSLKRGEEVIVTDINNGWAAIAFGGKKRYVKASFLERIPEQNSPKQGVTAEEPNNTGMANTEQTITKQNPTETETVNSPTTNKKHAKKNRDGWELDVNPGFDIYTKGGGGAISVDAELGKRLNQNFYWGGGVGILIPTTSGVSWSVPITTNIKVFMPSERTTIVPYAMLKAGYALNVDEIEASSVLLQIMPGIQFPITESIDLNLGAGYTHFIQDAGNFGSVSLRMGFNFHHSTAHKAHPLRPSQASKVQLTVEAEGALNTEESTFSIIASYKLSQLLMAGIGYGFANDNFTASEDGSIAFEGSYNKLFARGIYRFNDKRFAPIVACDLGMRFYKKIDDDYFEYSDGDMEKFSGMFVSPTFGLSIRPVRDLYLDIMGGYTFAGEKEFTFSKTKYNQKGNFSGALIKLGLTYTFP